MNLTEFQQRVESLTLEAMSLMDELDEKLTDEEEQRETDLDRAFQKICSVSSGARMLRRISRSLPNRYDENFVRKTKD